MKRMFALLLTLVMVFSLAACGGGKQVTAEREDPKAEEPKAEEPKTEASAEGDTIKIGVYNPMTGAQAGSGLTEIDAIQIAIDDVNAAGGINGRKLEMIAYDDAGTTEGATKAATRLIEEDGVKVIIGSFQSPSVLAVSELTEKAKVLHVGNGTGATWTNIGLDYTYRSTAIATLPIASMIDQMIDMEMKSFALISVESEYGQSGRSSILAAAEAAKIEVKADLTYQPADTDFTGVIVKALAAGADTVVLYGMGPDMALVIKQLRQNGYDDVIFTIEGGANSEMFSVAGSASDGLIFSAAYVVPDSPEGGATELERELLQKHWDLKGAMPYSDCFYRAYDGIALVIEALKSCDNVDDGESIMKAFKALSGVELVGGTFDFTGGTGDGLSSANKYMIMDGQWKLYDKAALQAWRG